MTDASTEPVRPHVVARFDAEGHAWPAYARDVERIVALVMQRLGDPAASTELRELALADLAWADALLRQDPEAIRRFEADVLAGIGPALARIDASAEFVDMIRHELRVKLLVGGDRGEPPKLSAYAGRGPLRHWVLVSAIRLAYDAKRRRGDREDPHDDLDAVLFDDAEQSAVRVESRALLKQWIEEGLRALDEKRRGVLQLYVVEDLSSESIGRMYGVHRGTVARWIDEARESVRSHVRRRALATPGMGPEAVASLLHAADGHLSLSLSMLR